MFRNHTGLVLTVMEQGRLRRLPAQAVRARVMFQYHRVQLLLARNAVVQEMMRQIRLLIVSNAAAKDLLSQADPLSAEPISYRKFFHIPEWTVDQ